ncbi:hypothetical protein [Asticcacaulis sp.]|uniref:hypothetical protein n=1 Tax=Asticcacaulis sp. TaxID=1872648 RepID=UPI00261C0A8D|nr:hypothetical protein [Asticcacaulis sp.]
MPSDFNIYKKSDGRVIVIIHSACAISIETILALLMEAGVDKEKVTFLRPDEVGDCVGIGMADLPVVIPVDQENCESSELDIAGRLCGQAGGRVIVLFGEAFPYTGLHPIADKYGNQCGWSADELTALLQKPEFAPPRDSSSAPVTRPHPSQVKC